ncbi:MAG: hypothetical protein CMN30_17620 [Sandaracinus sp.]|nr:hypothetical protein [Sandaracinus sp.]
MSRFAFVLAALLGFVATASAQRAPYLQRLTQTEVTVVWRDDLPSGFVCWGTERDALTERVAATRTGSQHEALLTGLEPVTQYYYAATDGSCPAEAEPNDRFTTSPETGTREPFRVWVVGDSGTGGTRQAEVRDAMLAYVGASRPDIFVHVGDMAYSDGTTREFTDNFFGMYANVLRNTNTWPAIGNHEGHSADSGLETGPYYEAYVLPGDGRAGGLPSGTEAYYSFDHANVHFIVLDSYDSPRTPDGAMLTWMEADLAATDQEWLVAYWHHPAYTKGSHDSDTETQLVQMRENALPILESYGVDLVIAGHSHIYERSYQVRGAYDTPTTSAGYIVDSGDGWLRGDGPYDALRGTVYVTAGHGGAGISGPGEHPLMAVTEWENGSVILDVNGPSLTLRNIRRDGVVSDEMTLLRGQEDTLVLVSPLGGESVSAGGSLPIRWVAPDDTTGILVELSVDGGVNWLTVAEEAVNDGVYEFLTPLVRTDEARVRLTDVNQPERFAESGDFSLVGARDVEVIPYGAQWEYWDDPAAPPSEWQTQTGGWDTGAAELGYGDGDEATEIRDEDPNVPTNYFRRSITVGGAVTRAELEVIFDDGVAVFVNGVEVLHENVENGRGHDDFASGSSGDDALVTTLIDGALFEEGENIVAVLVKQANATSSDLSFDLRLQLSVERDLPYYDGGTVELSDAGEIFRDASARPPVTINPDSGHCGCGVISSRGAVGALPTLLALGFLFRRRRR